MDLFPEFKLIEDYGFYEWRPVDKDHSRFTRDDILWGLNGSETDRAGTKPPYVNQDVFKRSLYPLSLRSLPPNILSKNAADPPRAVPIYVAGVRGLNLSTIDFMIGGTPLDILAKREFHKDSRRPQGDDEIPYDVTSIGPSGRGEKEMLVISRGKGYEYKKDLSDPGYQFERLVTSEEPLSNRDNCYQAMSAREDGTSIHKVQTMRIGDFKVLVDTEVDAIDDLNQPVEIKSGNPKYFGTKLMFQMISSGSRNLVKADKKRGSIVGVDNQDILSVANEWSTPGSRKRFQSKIISGLEAIQIGWKENGGRPGDRLRISFVGSQDIELEDEGGKFESVPQDVIDRALGPYFN